MRITDLFESGPIKLGGFKKETTDAPARAFMNELEEMTHDHPFTRGMRYFEDGPVLVQISPSLQDAANAVELRDIQSKAKGAGSRAMAALCGLADKTRTTIDLYAKGYGDVPTSKLVQFYERFGFSRADNFDIDDGEYGDGVEMMRRPNEALHEKRYPLVSGGLVDLISNPTHRKIYSMLGPNKAVRGGITKDMRFIVWNAHDALHDDVSRALDVRFTYKLCFFETIEDMKHESDWGWGNVYEGAEGAFYFICGPKIIPEHAAMFPVLSDASRYGTFHADSGRVRPLDDEA